MRNRVDIFKRFIVLTASLIFLTVDIFSLDITALNGVWTENIMAVGNGKYECNFSWGKGKITLDDVIFFDIKEGLVGISEEGLFEIRNLKQEDANTVSMTIHNNPKKGGDRSSDLPYFRYHSGAPDESYFIRVHFESYNKIWLEGKGEPRYRMFGPSKEMAGADFEPIESVFGERVGDFCYTVENEKVTITRYLNNAASKVDIPSSIKGMPVKTIGYGAFSGCPNLNVNIPRGVTHIEGCAFSGAGLTSVVIPDGVVSIGDLAFLGCKALTSVVMFESVTRIGFSAFTDCVNLKSVVLPNSITSIKSSAFAGCSSLETITLPSSITDIDPWVFSYCSSLKSIKLPAGLSGIWWEAFDHCSSLTSIELPAGLSYIGPGAFKYCSSLKAITISRGVKQIDPGMFSGCDNLISIKIFRSTGIKLYTDSRSENEEFMKKVRIEYIMN